MEEEEEMSAEEMRTLLAHFTGAQVHFMVENMPAIRRALKRWMETNKDDNGDANISKYRPIPPGP